MTKPYLTESVNLSLFIAISFLTFTFLLNRKSWMALLNRKNTIELTSNLLFIPRKALTAIPWVIITAAIIFWGKIFWLELTNHINNGFLDISLPTRILALSIGLFFQISAFQRLVNFPQAPLGLHLDRSNRCRFVVHLKCDYNNKGIRKQDFIRAIETGLTSETIAEMRLAGASELIIGSLWLHKTDRLSLISEHLKKISPNGFVKNTTTKMGAIESLKVRFIQLLTKFIDSRNCILQRPSLRVWVSFSKLAFGPIWKRPIMNAVVLRF